MIIIGLDQYLYTNSKAMSKAINKPEEGAPEYEVHWVEYRAKAGIAAQWRKANQIHKWFVDNVQGGNDDCGTYEVGVEQLQELLGIVNKVLDSTRLVKGKVNNGYSFDHNLNKVYHVGDGLVLEDASTARELLPTQEGFFFGGYDYDEYYWRDLEFTKEQLEKILGMVEQDEDGWNWHCKGEDDWNLTLQYHSSW